MDRDEDLCDNNCNKGYKFGIVPEIQVTVSSIFLVFSGETTTDVYGSDAQESLWFLSFTVNNWFYTTF